MGQTAFETGLLNHHGARFFRLGCNLPSAPAGPFAGPSPRNPDGPFTRDPTAAETQRWQPSGVRNRTSFWLTILGDPSFDPCLRFFIDRHGIGLASTPANHHRICFVDRLCKILPEISQRPSPQTHNAASRGDRPSPPVLEDVGRPLAVHLNS